MKPFGIQSDTHNHSWHAFSTILESGVNSRLQTILDETLRLAYAVKKIGGSTIYHTGDLFHVRGNIAPSVLNPTLDLYRHITTALGLKVRILAGNHDLEGRDADRLGSAITALEGVGCEVVNTTTYFFDDQVAMIPWHQDVTSLKAEIQKVHDEIEDGGHSAKEWHLMVHAPVDGVISGLPSHGLTDVELSAYGFKSVFSGHYHNHKDFGNGVYSVGASTHQTWSDIGSKAGFLLVTAIGVRWFKSKAPCFIEIDSTMDSEEIKQLASGNYIRAKINSAKATDVEAMRTFLLEAGAKGITILTTKVAVEAERSGAMVSAGASIEVSVSEFIKKSTSTANAEKLTLLCNSILDEARAQVAE